MLDAEGLPDGAVSVDTQNWGLPPASSVPFSQTQAARPYTPESARPYTPDSARPYTPEAARPYTPESARPYTPEQGVVGTTTTVEVLVAPVGPEDNIGQPRSRISKMMEDDDDEEVDPMVFGLVVPTPQLFFEGGEQGVFVVRAHAAVFVASAPVTRGRALVWRD